MTTRPVIVPRPSPNASVRREPVWMRDKIANIPVRWARHYVILHSLRERLLQGSAWESMEASQPIETHSMSPADSATDEIDHEITFCLLSHEQDGIREIDAAIHRILKGTYGICEESGERIPDKRLRVLPWTRYTKDVQDRREKDGLVTRLTIPGLRSIQGRDEASFADVENPESDELLTQEVERHQLEAELRKRGQGSYADIPPQVTRNATTQPKHLNSKLKHKKKANRKPHRA